jgi:hypothetical protein
MLKQVVPESKRIDFQTSTKILSGIFKFGDKSTKINETKEDRHFLLMLKAGLEALDAKEEKATAVNEMHGSLKNDVGKKENLERKHEMNNNPQMSEEKSDECQVDSTDNPAGLQSNNYLKTDDNVVQDRSVDVVPEESGENNPVGLQRLMKGIGTEGGVLKSFDTDAENGVPLSPDKDQLKDVNNIVSNALLEKGIDENDINKILAIIKEGELKSVPLESQVGEAGDSGAGMLKEILSDSGNGKVAVPESLLAALREKGIDENDINKILAVIKEGELKSAPLERQVGEAMVEKDSIVSILKGMSSDSNPERGESSGDPNSLSEKGKVTVPESFTLAEQADLTVYGSDFKVIRSGGAKSIDDHLLVSQITSQLPSGIDKSSGRVKITLYPEHLGSLDMDIIFRENKVQVVLMAESHDVRQELQSREGQLRDALQGQGLQVDGIDFLLRQSSQEMDGGSGGSHLWWREDNGNVKKDGKKERDMPVSSAISLLVTGKTVGTMEGGISLFV